MENEVIKVTARCPVRTTLEMLGGKWRLLILLQLSNQSLRPSELLRLIPDISEKMLLQELKNLMDNELIARIDYEVLPPRVEYCITDKGKLTLPLIDEMKKFAEAYHAAL